MKCKSSKPFKLEKGVRQGDTLSPKLLTACLQLFFQSLNRDWKGNKTHVKYLNILRFADGIFLIAYNVEHLKDMLNKLNEASKIVELHMNFKKIQITRKKII